ncbi:MAG: type II toxin-antitoxin system ParD family antitoxin, partial [Magnetococcales bacterium]|nr:type II toxin-antitoxin system ParD family antitoxin [Magnetococcales bacterium]
VKARVKEGRYSSASEVVREGLRLLIDQEEIRAEKIASKREAQQVEYNESENVEGVPMANVFKGMDKMKAYTKNTK